MIISTLQKDFIKISQKYIKDKIKIDYFWTEIEEAYYGRAYHNLRHIEAIYQALYPLKEQIDDWESLVYAIVYHDFVYEVVESNNEQKSAIIAQKRLQELSLPIEKQQKVFELIMATKGHIKTEDKDTTLFIDADLSILGTENYVDYQNAIRAEYAIFSDEAYKKGRKEVLVYFLNQKRLYQSEYFFKKYEKRARENIKNELDSNL